ncbi:hypothetical protein N0V85_009401, partial [Neurospora sp. IMI 360204]
MTRTHLQRTSISDESRPLLSHHDTEELLSSQRYYGTDGTVARDDGGLEDCINFDDDPDNPQNWPTPFKWSVVALLAMTAFSV